MKTANELKIIRRLLLFFMAALFLSGLTAIPVDAQLSTAIKIIDEESAMHQWLVKVLLAYRQTAVDHPFLLYGYDWLAFAHFVLAILFIGPYKDPVRNSWVVQFGLIACALVLPYAFVAGHYRAIPLGWRLIDSLFGVFGFALLWIIRTRIKKLEASLATAQAIGQTDPAAPAGTLVAHYQAMETFRIPTHSSLLKP